MVSPEVKLSVYLSGAHSTGKTTLQKNLQKHPEFSKFRFKDQEEVARIWIKNNGIKPNQLADPMFLFNFEKDIVKLQHSAEKRELEENDGNFTRFLWDRSIIDPIGYVKAYVGDSEANELSDIPFVKTMLERLKAGDNSLIFVIKPHKTFMESDGVRAEPEFEGLERLHNAMINIMEVQNIHYKEITCIDLQQRTQIVLDAVKTKWNWDTLHMPEREHL